MRPRPAGFAEATSRLACFAGAAAAFPSSWMSAAMVSHSSVASSNLESSSVLEPREKNALPRATSASAGVSAVSSASSLDASSGSSESLGGGTSWFLPRASRPLPAGAAAFLPASAFFLALSAFCISMLSDFFGQSLFQCL